MKIIPIGGRGYDCNLFLLKDPASNQYDLIDGGVGLDQNRILAEVAAVVDPHRIQRVAVTHEHFDHTGGLPHWQNLGARIVTSGPTADKLAAGYDVTSKMFGTNLPVLAVDEVVGDGDHVVLGGANVAVLGTPGHSPGSLCYWHEGTGTLFSGDTVFAGGGIGRFDFPDGDVRVLYESILRLERLPVRALHCGHGPSVAGESAAVQSLHGSVQHITACQPDTAGPSR